MQTQLLSPSEENILKAAELLSQDEVVALPTETVYGLAGNATHPVAVNKIFAAKERPSFDPLIVHVSQSNFLQSKGVIASLVEQNILSSQILTWQNLAKIEALLAHFWPGPLTLVLPRGSAIPHEVTSNHDTVAIRMPDHPLFQAVLSKISFPLAAPSANRFGRISPTQASSVLKELGGRIPAILDGGACVIGVESTILKLSEKKAILLRPGKIGATEIEKFLEVTVELYQKSSSHEHAPLAPGLLDQHYAPKKLLYLMPITNAQLENKKIGYLRMSELSPTGSLEEIAQKLFQSLRELDESNHCDVIVADLPAEPKDLQNLGLWMAICDRLGRASSK